MSDIVLSASVRQNLLSLQSTADLLATTQGRLSTGKKVNSALDNPTNYFTAQALDNRASDINNLLDGISNGVQVLQAANTGLTALQKLVDSAKSVANQVLQSTTGFSSRSTVKAIAVSGATAQNLLGTPTGAPVDATYNGNPGTSVTAATSAQPGAEIGNPLSGVTDGTETVGVGGGFDLSSLAGKTITVGTQTITFDSGATSTDDTTTPGTTVIGVGAGSTSTLADILDAFDTGAGGTHSIDGTTGAVTLTTADAASDIAFTGADKTAILTVLGLSGADVDHVAAGSAGTGQVSTGTLLSGTASAGPPAVDAVSAAFSDGDTITVNGKIITFSASDPTSTDANGGTINIAGGTVQDLLTAIDQVTGAATPSTYTAGKAAIHTGTTDDLSITATSATAKAALNALGLGTGGTGVSATRAAAPGGLSGLELTIASTGGGTATDITFGTGPGQISTLNQLNDALLANNLQASIDPTGAITITTTNDSSSATIGAIGGSAAAAGNVFAGLVGDPPVADPTSQQARAGLVVQYNDIIASINTTAQDASFSGINLLNGDTLKLIFNETGKSVLNITGPVTDAASLGLGPLTQGTDFVDSNSANEILTALNAASSQLRTAASTLGSNLSIVQIRQDFNKNLINVLQTGSSNLTLADTNEEAANSQALSTRQSIAVSALALANQSQQSVLQLLR